MKTKTGQFEQVQLPEDLEQRTKGHRKPGTFGKTGQGPVSDNRLRYTGKSPQDCAAMRFTCAKGEKYFSDTTGCGCEPDSHQSPGR